jgi:hypothetical protein
MNARALLPFLDHYQRLARSKPHDMVLARTQTPQREERDQSTHPLRIWFAVYSVFLQNLAHVSNNPGVRSVLALHIGKKA